MSSGWIVVALQLRMRPRCWHTKLLCEPAGDYRTTLLTRSSPVAFKVYDVDRDGYISNGELFLVLKMMVGNNLKVRIGMSMATRKSAVG